MPFSADELRAERQRVRGRARERLAFKDINTHVREPVPIRASGRTPITDGALHGCRAKKRDICSHMLSAMEAPSFNALRVKQNSYVTGLGAAAARSCRQLVLFSSMRVLESGD